MPLAKLSPNARAKAVLSPPPAMPRRPRAARLSSLVHELVTRFRQVFFNVDRRRGASGAASRRRIMNLRVLTIAAIALTVWIVVETASRRTWAHLVAIPATFCIGVSCGLPLYLFLRSRPGVA